MIQLYQDLVEVKADLEGLIKIKRELQRHNFIAAEAPFSSNLISLREKFNTVGEDITKTKGTLSKSLRRVQKLKRAVDETDQWAKEVFDTHFTINPSVPGGNFATLNLDCESSR